MILRTQQAAVAEATRLDRIYNLGGAIDPLLHAVARAPEGQIKYPGVAYVVVRQRERPEWEDRGYKFGGDNAPLPI